MREKEIIGIRKVNVESTPMSRLLSPGPIIALLLALAVGIFLFIPKLDPDLDKPEVVQEHDYVFRDAKELFLAGKWEEGHKRLAGYEGGYRRWQMEQMQAIVNRVDAAMSKAEEARLAWASREPEKAAKLMAEAARMYPEKADLAVAADTYAGQVAFNRKDYGLYLSLAENNAAKAPNDLDMVLWLANARATMYGATGSLAMRDGAEAALVQAEAIASNIPAAARHFQEAAAGIREQLKAKR
jgi:hypothetical protein